MTVFWQSDKKKDLLACIPVVGMNSMEKFYEILFLLKITFV